MWMVKVGVVVHAVGCVVWRVDIMLVIGCDE